MSKENFLLMYLTVKYLLLWWLTVSPFANPIEYIIITLIGIFSGYAYSKFKV